MSFPTGRGDVPGLSGWAVLTFIRGLLGQLDLCIWLPNELLAQSRLAGHWRGPRGLGFGGCLYSEYASIETGVVAVMSQGQPKDGDKPSTIAGHVTNI